MCGRRPSTREFVATKISIRLGIGRKRQMSNSCPAVDSGTSKCVGDVDRIGCHRQVQS